MNDEITQKQRTFVAILCNKQNIYLFKKHNSWLVNPINQNILKIEKNYTFIHHETGLSRWKCSFFLFSICITLYLSVSSTALYGKIETLTSQLTKTCIVNKNRMRHWLLSEVNRHDILDKSLSRAKRRTCNSNFSTECQGLDTEFRLKSSTIKAFQEPKGDRVTVILVQNVKV